MDTTENVAPQDWNKGWPTLKTPDPSATTFLANGKEYRRINTISFDRYEAYELLQQEIGLARTFSALREQIQEAYDLLNQPMPKPVDAGVVLRDILIGTTLVGERQTHAVLKMCALFLVREGEDLRYIDEPLIESKVDDWRKEGISIGYFFQFALVSIPGYIEAFKAISRDTSAGTVGVVEAGAESST